MAQLRNVFQNRRLPKALITYVILGWCFLGSVAYGQEPDPDGEARALALLQEILGRPEFQWEAPRETLLQRAWEWFVRQFFNLLPEVAGSGRTATVILAVLGTTALLAVLGYIAIRVRRQLATNVEPETDSDLSRWRDADEVLASAQSVAEQGDYRLALRYLYLSSLLSLHERGLINYDRTRTNLEYLQSVSHRPQLAAILGEIVRVFDRSWYGIQTPDAETYEQFIGYVQSLRELR